MNIALYFGLVAGICTTISFLPQVLKIWRTKSVNDLSLLMFLIYIFGVANRLIYGLIIKEKPIILANTVALILCLLILIGIVKFKNK